MTPSFVRLAGMLAALGAFAALCTARANAQDALPALPVVNRALTLSGAIDVAMMDNLTLRAAQADADAALDTARSAAAQSKPSLSTTTYATAGDSPNTFAASPGVAPHNVIRAPGTPFGDQNLMLMVPLYTGGRLAGRTQEGKSEADAAGAMLNSTRLSVTEAVSEAYATALYRQRLVGVVQARLTAEDEQVRITQLKVATGKFAPVDLLREQAEQADAQQSLLQAQNDAAQAVIGLKVVLGVSQDSPITLSDTLEDLSAQARSLPAGLPEAQRLALSRRPEIFAAAQDVEAAKDAVKDAQGAYAPQVYGVAMGDVTTLAQGIGRTGYAVGLTASLPLSDGGERRADVDAAKARVSRALAQEQIVRQTVIQEVSDAWLSLQTAMAANKAAVSEVTAAAEAYRLEDLRYNAGKSVAAERLDALAALTRAQGSEAQSLAELVAARAKLQQALGLP